VIFDGGKCKELFMLKHSLYDCSYPCLLFRRFTTLCDVLKRIPYANLLFNVIQIENEGASGARKKTKLFPHQHPRRHHLIYMYKKTIC
jgi:hypothetical protein